MQRSVRVGRDGDGEIAWRQTSGGRTVHARRDGSGRVVAVSAEDGDTTIHRNDVGRIVFASRAHPDGVSDQTTSLTYDGPLLTGIESHGPLTSRIDYRYGPGWRPVERATREGTTERIDYDADGLIVGDGPLRFTRDPATGIVTQSSDGLGVVMNTHDDLGRLVRRECHVGDAAVYDLVLHYDRAGRVHSRTETVGGQVAHSTYDYDPAGQLVAVRRSAGAGATPEHVERYAYDISGNRLSAMSTRSADPRETSIVYDADGVATSIGGHELAVDGDGLMIVHDAQRLRYGHRFELLRADSERETSYYAYDGFGRRVARSAPDGWHTYLYDDALDPTRVVVATHPSGRRRRFYHDPAGVLVAYDERRNEAGPDQRFYVASDQVGSPQVIVDASAAVVAIIHRDSFGRPVAGADPHHDLEIEFGGGIVDPVTGFVTFGLRDYDPVVGRWTTPDPVGWAATDMHLWRYCWNDPINRRDRNGLADAVATAGGPRAATTTSSGQIDFHARTPPTFTEGPPAWTQFNPNPPNYAQPWTTHLAGDKNPTPGLTDQGAGLGAGNYSGHIKGRSCRVSAGSPDVTDAPPDNQFPGVQHNADPGEQIFSPTSDKGGVPASGGSLTVHF